MATPNTAVGAPASIYQLKITLEGFKPPIWRRVLVRADITLDRLHRVIQRAMGWHNNHLHEFRVGDARYGRPDIADRTLQAEARFTLWKLAPNLGLGFRYRYDFKDNWWHSIKVERLLDPDPTHEHPTCSGGGNACPPEHVGGVSGYANMLDAIRNPLHQEHQNVVGWLGGDFDCKHFDIESANLALHRIEG